MKSIKLMLVLFGLVVTAFAQEKGIQFRNFDNWEAAVLASKKENKPLFVDFFTTWCGPCKMLEKDVYPRKEVGDYFNQHYIALKVQMDRTKNDPEQVKKWYSDIKMLEEKFKIKGYPTLLVISPDGEIRNNYAGYLSPEELIKMAKISLQSGKRYLDLADKYYDVIRAYQNGRDGMAIAKLVNKLVADETNYFQGRPEVIDSLTKASMTYFRTQDINSLYTKDALGLIGRVGLKSNDPLFKLFYPNVAKVDQIVGRNKYGRLLVDRSIQEEFFFPDRSSNRKSPLSTKAVNWDSLYTAVKLRYNEEYALRNVDAAKVISYSMKKDIDNFTKSTLDFVDKYGTLSFLLIAPDGVRLVGLDKNDMDKMEALAINSFCYGFVFRYSSDQFQLKSAINMMTPLVELAEKKKAWWFSQLGDTYANLLFKTGDREQAIAIQTRIVDFAKKRNDPESYVKQLQSVLAKIMAGTPTWIAEQK